jgi:hypothetical protein
MDTDMGELTATYRGREYIELYLDGKQFQDIINVFDYREGSPRIEDTPEAVEFTLTTWLTENYPELTVHSISRMWRSGNE